VQFRFALPEAAEMNLLGQVAWANSNGQAGIQFVDLTDAQRSAIGEWLVANAPQAPPSDPEPLTQCKLTDLSVGGCYIESESPFPPQTVIELWLKAADLEIHVPGVVRVVHPTHGMGVEFSNTSDVHTEVENFIHVLSSHSDIAPQLLVAPKSISFHAENSPVIAQSDDDLLHLLANHAELTEDAFLTELRRQRRSETEATTA